MVDSSEWYLPDPNGDEPLGPYTKDQLIDRIRKGELSLDNYAWSTKFADQKWRRLSELSDFRDTLAKYPRAPVPKMHTKGLSQAKKPEKFDFSTKGNYGRGNLYRRFPRVPLSARAVVHNQKIYSHAECVDVSEKGVFVKMPQTDLFEKGEEVVVTLRQAPYIGTVSVAGVVMRLASEGDQSGYGIFFLRLNPLIRRRIAKYVLRELEKKEKKVKEEKVA